MRCQAPGAPLEPQQEALARQGLKALMLLRGRPLLDYIADVLRRAGVQRICLVVAPDAEQLRQHAARIADASGLSVSIAVQPEPLGTADAVLAAGQFVGSEPFLLCNGDDLYPVGAVKRLCDWQAGGCVVVAFDAEALWRKGNIAPERAKDFAAVEFDDSGRLLRIVEKPQRPEQYRHAGKLWVNMNLYRFEPVIFEFCRAVQPDPERGELELTAAVNDLVRSGRCPFRVLTCQEGVLDITSRADVKSAERLLDGWKFAW